LDRVSVRGSNQAIVAKCTEDFHKVHLIFVNGLFLKAGVGDRGSKPLERKLYLHN
jgi:hypothetical protein